MSKLTMRHVDEYIVSTLFQGKTETNPAQAARVLLACENYTEISRSVLKLLYVPISKIDIANHCHFIHDRHFEVKGHIVVNHRPLIVVDVPSEGKLLHIDGFTGNIVHWGDNMGHML